MYNNVHLTVKKYSICEKYQNLRTNYNTYNFGNAAEKIINNLHVRFLCWWLKSPPP